MDNCASLCPPCMPNSQDLAKRYEAKDQKCNELRDKLKVTKAALASRERELELAQRMLHKLGQEKTQLRVRRLRRLVAAACRLEEPQQAAAALHTAAMAVACCDNKNTFVAAIYVVEVKLTCFAHASMPVGAPFGRKSCHKEGSCVACRMRTLRARCTLASWRPG